jgi:hypothetical protein
VEKLTFYINIVRISIRRNSYEGEVFDFGVFFIVNNSKKRVLLEKNISFVNSEAFLSKTVHFQFQRGIKILFEMVHRNQSFYYILDPETNYTLVPNYLSHDAFYFVADEKNIISDFSLEICCLLNKENPF